MDKISAALDSPIGRLVDNTSPKIGAVAGMIGGTAWYMAIPWDNVTLIASAIGGVFFAIERGLRLIVYLRNNFIKRKELVNDSDDN